MLEAVHQLRAARLKADPGRTSLLWPWSRPTGWRYIRAVTREAGIEGLHASGARRPLLATGINPTLFQITGQPHL
jgi:hypothetical protein